MTRDRFSLKWDKTAPKRKPSGKRSSAESTPRPLEPYLEFLKQFQKKSKQSHSEIKEFPAPFHLDINKKKGTR